MRDPVDLAELELATQVTLVHVPLAAPDSVAFYALPRAPDTSAPGVPVLLFDGHCGMCARSVQFVLAHESARTGRQLRFAPLQGDFGSRVALQFPLVATANSVVWFAPAGRHGSRIRLRSDAALSVFEYLGGVWRVLAVLGRAVPRPMRDAMYSAIAVRRHTLTAPACLLPNADERVRFLP